MQGEPAEALTLAQLWYKSIPPDHLLAKGETLDVYQ
jgi:hypothetical protein